MSTITQMVNAVNSIKLRDAVPVIIQSTEKELIELNQSQLFFTGKDKNGQELKPYAFLTEQYKLQKGQPFDRTTLKDTGSFYNGFFIRVDTNLITFDSTDSKTSDLEKKYGENIFGLTNENKSLYSFGAFYEGVKKHITAKTGLQFV